MEPPGSTAQRNPIADRIIRALQHKLRLLHRPNPSTFYVLGATCNVYTVTLTTKPTCTCPDRMVPCKHILFVLIQSLGLSPNDTCLRRRTLRPSQLDHLLAAPARPDSLASHLLRQQFHRMLSKGKMVKDEKEDEAASCPICLEDISGGTQDLMVCRVCKNVVHAECMLTWKRSRGRRPASCVICRSKWKDFHNRIRVNANNFHDRYLNLADYMQEDDSCSAMGEDDPGTRSCGG